jgi:hypothetical protein
MRDRPHGLSSLARFVAVAFVAQHSKAREFESTLDGGQVFSLRGVFSVIGCAINLLCLELIRG